jgi:iron complex outermembrane recepter protein
VNQLSSITPGIFINSDQTGRNTKIKIRGVGPDEQSNIRPSIGFFYNDIPLMTQQQGGQSVASDLDLGDLTRIEILKGPQSTLFGESVTGGAIAFYNRRPSLEDGTNGRVSVNMGSHSLQQFRGSAGAALGEQFAFRVAAYKNELDDQVRNTVDGSRRELSSEGYSAQLLYQPSDALRFLLEYNHRESEQHGGANDGMDVLSYGAQTIADAAAQGITLTPADPFDRKVQMVFPFEEEMENELASLHVYWDINDCWSLTSVTGHQSNEDRYYGSEALGGYNASNSVTAGFFAQGVQEIDYTTQELRLNFAGERLNSMFGVFYANYDSPESRGDFGFVFPGFVFPLAQYITVDQDTWSVFSHNSYEFSERWELVFGARYTQQDAEGRNGLANFQGIYNGAPLDESMFPIGESDEDAWGGTLKLLHHLNENVTVYAGVDRGFRLGGINNLGQPNYDTEVAINYEAGIKGLFLENTVRLGATVFHTEYDGYQAVSYNSDSFTFITQNADVTGDGVEVEVAWAPIRQLELGFSALYNRVEYDEYLGATCDNYQLANGLCPNDPVAGAQDLSGETLSAAPRTSANFSAQYTDMLADTGFEWYVRGEYSFRDSSYSHPVGINGDPLQEIDSYGIVNASLGLVAAQGWSLVVWGKNLADEDYFTNISRQPVGSEPDYVHGRIGWERSYGATVSYEF